MIEIHRRVVRLGAHDLRTDDILQQDMLVARSVPHENHEPNFKINDIAIVHLLGDAEFSG